VSNFNDGKQPCYEYDPDMDGNGEAVWANEHECWCNKNDKGICGGLVSFCKSCTSDHHDGGYESCTGCKELATASPYPNVHQDNSTKDGAK